MWCVRERTFGHDGRFWCVVLDSELVGGAGRTQEGPLLGMTDTGEVAVSPASSNSRALVAGQAAIELGKG